MSTEKLWKSDCSILLKKSSFLEIKYKEMRCDSRLLHNTENNKNECIKYLEYLVAGTVLDKSEDEVLVFNMCSLEFFINELMLLMCQVLYE